jgi:DNA-directed RNA polymerase beta subunit
MMNVLYDSILDSNKEELKIGEEKIKINNQKSALLYLANNLKDNKKYNSLNNDIKEEKKLIHVYNILANDFLPHQGTINNDIFKFNIDDYVKLFRKKSCYLGLMVNKFISCFLNRSNPDDRDSYVNKRVELAGT